jgi:SAM-dependent methyltransferase
MPVREEIWGDKWMKSWIEYWNSDHPIYVNDRHLSLHYRGLAQGIADLIPGPDAVVLDFGCGEALSADLIARSCRRLLLVDSAPSICDKLKARFGANRSIQVLSPDEAKALAGESLDLVVIHSVAQYVAKNDFSALIAEFVTKLKPGGSLIVGDILPEGLSALTDAKALLTFGFEGGFLIPAFFGLIRTALSDYRKIRSELGLTHYTEVEMLALLERAGLTARRLEKNLGHNQARMAFGSIKFPPPAAETMLSSGP